MRLFHATSLEAAAQIETHGFTESKFAGIASGVFLSDRPLDGGDGASTASEVVFAVDAPSVFDLDKFELLEEGRPPDAYREWLIPAALVNGWPRSRHADNGKIQPAPQRS